VKDEEVDATWNYRLIKRNVTEDKNNLTMHEVYYRKGKPSTYTEKPVSPFGESITEIKEDLEKMLLAINKPILKDTDFD